MLGTELRLQLGEQGAHWVGTGREVDVGNLPALEAFASANSEPISWIINCSAYTAVDKAEEDEEACWRLNVTGAENLAKLAAEIGATLVHLSTDYVFDGKGIAGTHGNLRPYLETDPTGPQGVYGRTKAEGETRIAESCRNHLILRTAWLYGGTGPSFVHTMLRLMNSKDALGIVADQFGSPTWTGDLAAVILAIIGKSDGPNSRVEFGVYHVSGEGQCSWFDFAAAILSGGTAHGLLDPARKVTLNPLTTEQYPTKAKRPAWSVLSKDKLKSAFGLTLPSWQDSLKTFLSTLSRL